MTFNLETKLKENIADVFELNMEDMREKYIPQGVMLDEEEIIFA